MVIRVEILDGMKESVVDAVEFDGTQETAEALARVMNHLVVPSNLCVNVIECPRPLEGGGICHSQRNCRSRLVRSRDGLLRDGR
jgi:hypothetical protein